MGRKQARARKHVYLCIAGVMSILLVGCASSEKVKVEIKERGERRQDRNLRSQEFLNRRDFEEALKECRKILSLPSPESPKDRALFHIGLIYAHPENPKRDYGKSFDAFKKLTKDYPHSPLADEARAWIGVFLENERLIQRNEKLSQSNEKLSQTNEKLSQTVEKLNQVIEKSKQVDIEIEEKKREKPK